MGGMVLETNMTEILTRIEEQNKLEKEEVISCSLDECVFLLDASRGLAFYAVIFIPFL